MTEYRPHIFIGSSKEGKPIAEMISDRLKPVADCSIWTEQFDLGNSTYEDLINKLSLYDYGVLVGSGDDQTISRNKLSRSARDNVLFEFGMFAGRLGRHRSFLVAETGMKIPSDLNGITLPFLPAFRKNRDGSLTASELNKLKPAIKSIGDKIANHIKKRDKVIDYGFLPSTSLAYGYYYNFVYKVISTLLDTGTLMLGNTCDFPNTCQKELHGKPPSDPLHGMKVKDVSLTICLPKRLSANMFDHVKHLRHSQSWRLIKIDAGNFRPFDFHVQAQNSSKGTLQLLDMPLTLNALNDSIRSYVGKSYMGSSEAEKLLETRELRTFKRVLALLIRENPLTRGRAKIEIAE